MTARIRIDHPNYRREVELPPALRRQLVRDLTQEPQPLLRADAGPPAPREDALLFRRGRVRVRRPALPLGPGHVIVDVEPPAPLLEADSALHGEVLAVVLELAREISAQHGGCRIHSAVDASDAALRWHVLGPVR